MKTTEQLAHGSPGTLVDFPVGTHLLDSVIALRASVGDALAEDEFSCLLRESALPPEAGFTFLTFCAGFVTLNVPPQDLADWYPKSGWILPEKDSIARTIAAKYDLFLCEPPDVVTGCHYTGPDAQRVHHHLELGQNREIIVIAHPRFLKVRLYAGKSALLYAHAARSSLLLDPQLLTDLSALYLPRDTQ